LQEHVKARLAPIILEDVSVAKEQTVVYIHLALENYINQFAERKCKVVRVLLLFANGKKMALVVGLKYPVVVLPDLLGK
jgi:hypothetical protein